MSKVEICFGRRNGKTLATIARLNTLIGAREEAVMQERTVAYELWTKAKMNSEGVVEKPRARITPSAGTMTLGDTLTILTDLEGALLDEEIRTRHPDHVKKHGGVRCVEVVYPFGLGPQR